MLFLPDVLQETITLAFKYVFKPHSFQPDVRYLLIDFCDNLERKLAINVFAHAFVEVSDHITYCISDIFGRFVASRRISRRTC